MRGTRARVAAVLVLTAVVVVALRRDATPAPDATAGHQHGAGPDPLTAAVLTLNVVVLLGLAVLTRLRPPGVRRPGPARAKWRYRDAASVQPAAERAHSPAAPSTNPPRSN
jgi:hypothetical protein